MKRLLLIFSLLTCFGVFAQSDKDVPDKPNPPRLVNDYTGTLTAAQVEALEQKLVQYDDSTSNQVVVVIINTLGDFDVSDYARVLGRKWGVGGKEFNNGVILLVAKSDRKLRIEVGYGLEGAIPDITAKSIIDNDLTPNFKEENYYRGIDQATNSIIKAAAGEYKAPAGYRNKKGKGIPLNTIIIILIILFVLFRGGGRNTGGTYSSRRGSRGMGGFPWWIGPFTGGGGGGGGGWSGGGGGGGFGGGSFGGGGASGSW